MQVHVTGAESRKLMSGRKPKAIRAPWDAPALREKDVAAQVIGWLKAKRWHPVRLNSGLISTPDGRRMKVGDPGLPDYISVRGERYFFLELKAPGKKLGPKQADWFRFARSSNIPAIWADELSLFVKRYEEMFGE